MRLYKILPDWEQNNFQLDLKRQWSLPGVNCPTCKSQWANAGTIYAATSLEGLSNSSHYTEPRNVPLDEYLELMDEVRSANPDLLHLPPGAEFGQLVGAMRGQCTDLAIYSIASLLISLGAYKKLSAILEMPGTVAINCRNREVLIDPVLELDLPFFGRLTNPTITGSPDPCASCGRVGISLPNNPVVEVPERDAAINLFRLINFPTIVVATQEFVEAYMNLGLSGLKFSEVVSV
ncbi:MAG: hypothetical protein DWQ47_06845 [Acidobacteria bacterium]|nr:MAG: hypothetical protein DWQ32_10395 [Acidobacteriota bacterium]REK02090.1 MAG: hypothetical protein DWQ38_06825 [Acidobacteriota bacterium]REK15048.1 MAG: hypothetical protein DWQ43_16085 [Acidobacteriota bacterium]REK45762.1 MAG: hypothetical protein DWQ47_06845 [Acidobacteriota bacterium]